MSDEPNCTENQAFLLFHLNLSFSALEETDSAKIIELCYEPLLCMAERGDRPLAIELSGSTLEKLKQQAPNWLKRLRSAVAVGKVEIVGSGWAQVIGPLVPEAVNIWNQALGREAYSTYLQSNPRVALVNEMSFSEGLVDVYAEAGYSALILDRENVRAALSIEDHAPHTAPEAVTGPRGSVLPVIWSDTVLFQRFQRVVHGEISIKDYLVTLRSRVVEGQQVLPIYTNDAEVFGYRPGRYRTESAPIFDEWKRIHEVLDAIDESFAPEWITPSHLLSNASGARATQVTNICHPVIVKKQRKYNINRWALSGRDNLRLNTAAHKVTQAAQAESSTSSETWRRICEWWASDLRTHLADARWKRLEEKLEEIVPAIPFPFAVKADDRTTPSLEAQKHVTDTTVLAGSDVHLELDNVHGGVIRSVAFRSHGWEPCLGTLAQGSLSAIDVAVDFFTGGAVVDLPGIGRRITNLDRCRPRVESGQEFIRAEMVSGQTADGEPLAMTTIEIPNHGESIVMHTQLSAYRPHGSVRVCHLTFLSSPRVSPLWIETSLGGSVERFALDRDADHGAPVSMLVSSTTSLGGASGSLRIGNDHRMLSITWDPSMCAAIPMLHHRRVRSRTLTRLFFSLSELDDTFRPGGALLPLSICIAPA